MPADISFRVAGDEYDREDESLFRRYLENVLLDLSGKVDRIEGGKSSISTASSARLIFYMVPVGQVEVG